MTTDRISTRNRANARNSTGPKSARGKAIAAGNARRHGATARPDPESVAAWLSIILDRPHVTVGDLLPEDEGGYRALVLAQAEARLVAAEQALCDLERQQAKPDEIMKVLRAISDNLRVDAIRGEDPTRELRALQRLSTLTAGALADETRACGKQRRLLERYVREARAQRRRAFAAWAAVDRKGARAA